MMINPSAAATGYYIMRHLNFSFAFLCIIL